MGKLRWQAWVGVVGVAAAVVAAWPAQAAGQKKNAPVTGF
jgi:hypothetical protein